MTQEAAEEAGPRSSAPILGVIVVLLAVGLTAFFLRVSGIPGASSRDAVAFEPPEWRFTPGEEQVLAKVVSARRQVKRDRSEETTKSLLEAYAAFNLVDLKARGSVKSPRFQDAYAHFQQRANDLYLRLGKDAYVAWGQSISDDYLKALKAQNRSEIQRLGGTLYGELRGFGILDSQGLVRPGMEAVVHALLMMRWARILRESRIVKDLIHPLEYELTLRWKVASHPVLPLKRRFEVAKRLKKMGSQYRVEEALAARAAMDRDWKIAVHFYREAVKLTPNDSELKVRLEEAEHRFKQSAAGPL